MRIGSWSRGVRWTVIAGAVVAGAVGAWMVGSGAPASAQPAGAGGNPFDAQAVVAALEKTPGCLGADAAQTMSGKGVIFAWFENKAAAMAWRRSAFHQGAMQAAFPEFEDAGVPMQGVPDDVPIMAIASITPGDQPNPAIGGMPLSQILIELYTPLTGGISLGGTFAPEGQKVPGTRHLQAR